MHRQLKHLELNRDFIDKRNGAPEGAPPLLPQWTERLSPGRAKDLSARVRRAFQLPQKCATGVCK